MCTVNEQIEKKYLIEKDFFCYFKTDVNKNMARTLFTKQRIKRPVCLQNKELKGTYVAYILTNAIQILVTH